MLPKRSIPLLIALCKLRRSGAEAVELECMNVSMPFAEPLNAFKCIETNASAFAFLAMNARSDNSRKTSVVRVITTVTPSYSFRRMSRVCNAICSTRSFSRNPFAAAPLSRPP